MRSIRREYARTDVALSRIRCVWAHRCVECVPSFDQASRFLALDLSNPLWRWLSCLVNSASLVGANAVVPGEIVSLLGAGLGPQTGVRFRLEQDDRAPRQLAGTRVNWPFRNLRAQATTNSLPVVVD